MPGRYERCDDELAFDRRAGFGVFSLIVDLQQIARLDAELFCVCRTDQRRIVPGQLRDRVGQFLEPAVVCVAAVVHRITAAQHNLRRFWRRRRRWKRRRSRVRDAAGCVGIECGGWSAL